MEYAGHHMDAIFYDDFEELISGGAKPCAMCGGRAIYNIKDRCLECEACGFQAGFAANDGTWGYSAKIVADWNRVHESLRESKDAG